MDHLLRSALLRFAALCIGTLACTSCTVVQVREGKAFRSHFGVLRIVPDPASGLAAYRSAGVGLVPGVNGATLGYHREDVVVAAVGASCQIVVFELPDTAETATLWRDILRDHPNICMLEGEK